MPAFVVRKNTGQEKDGEYLTEFGDGKASFSPDPLKAMRFSTIARAEVAREDLKGLYQDSFSIFQMDIKLSLVNIKVEHQATPRGGGGTFA